MCLCVCVCVCFSVCLSLCMCVCVCFIRESKDLLLGGGGSQSRKLKLPLTQESVDTVRIINSDISYFESSRSVSVHQDYLNINSDRKYDMCWRNEVCLYTHLGSIHVNILCIQNLLSAVLPTLPSRRM